MPTQPTNPPEPNLWTLNASGITPAGDWGVKLVGCHIQLNATTGVYTFTEPNITKTLSTYTPPATPPSGPAPTSFVFPQFGYKEKLWNITVNLPITSGVNSTGLWVMVGNKQAFAVRNPQAPSNPNTNGEFTAQAGTGVVPVEDASAANA